MSQNAFIGRRAWRRRGRNDSALARIRCMDERADSSPRGGQRPGSGRVLPRLTRAAGALRTGSAAGHATAATARSRRCSRDPRGAVRASCELLRDRTARRARRARSTSRGGARGPDRLQRSLSARVERLRAWSPRTANTIRSRSLSPSRCRRTSSTSIPAASSAGSRRRRCRTPPAPATARRAPRRTCSVPRVASPDDLPPRSAHRAPSWRRGSPSGTASHRPLVSTASPRPIGERLVGSRAGWPDRRRARSRPPRRRRAAAACSPRWRSRRPPASVMSAV